MIKFQNSVYINSTSGKELNNNKEDEKFLRLICDKVEYAMESKKLYNIENLSINVLAEYIEIRPYMVSRAINMILKKSFVTLITEYRVNEVKNLMGSPKHSHLTLLGIAFEAGFTSKTTFHGQFKKITGQTPGEFKKQYIDTD